MDIGLKTGRNSLYLLLQQFISPIPYWNCNLDHGLVVSVRKLHILFKISSKRSTFFGSDKDKNFSELFGRKFWPIFYFSFNWKLGGASILGLQLGDKAVMLEVNTKEFYLKNVHQNSFRSKEIISFLTSNMAAVTSLASQQRNIKLCLAHKTSN